jgi:SAM-dependent methyltransferase
VIVCPNCRAGLDGLHSTSCGNCGWRGSALDGVPVLLSTRDRESELFGRYLNNYDRIAADDLKVSIQAGTLQQFFNDRLLGYLGSVAGLRVCDVGIGKGILFDELRRRGPASLVGVDISMPYLERFARTPEVTVVLANAENLPFRDAFDLVIATDILEHVMNVGDVMISIRESLVPGGRLVVRVPYKDDMLQYARLNGCDYDMVHLRNFAKDNLRHLLRHTGFVVEHLYYDGFAPTRARPWLQRTSVSTRLLNALGERVLGGQEGLERMSPRIGRLLMEPIVVTAVTRRSD